MNMSLLEPLGLQLGALTCDVLVWGLKRLRASADHVLSQRGQKIYLAEEGLSALRVSGWLRRGVSDCLLRRVRRELPRILG